MHLIRYLLDFLHINAAGLHLVKYAKDHIYHATEETVSHVNAGIAVIVHHEGGHPASTTVSEPFGTKLTVASTAANQALDLGVKAVADGTGTEANVIALPVETAKPIEPAVPSSSQS